MLNPFSVSFVSDTRLAIEQMKHCLILLHFALYKNGLRIGDGGAVLASALEDADASVDVDCDDDDDDDDDDDAEPRLDGRPGD